MRILSLLKKTMIENFRDWKIISLTLSFAPFFAVLMYLYFEAAAEKPYRIIVVDHDQVTQSEAHRAIIGDASLISTMEAVRDSLGARILEVEQVAAVSAGIQRIEARQADLLIEIPIQFTATLLDYSLGLTQSPVIVTTHGDPTNARYIMAAAWSDMIIYQYAMELVGVNIPLEIDQQTVIGMASVSEFDLYVPGLLGLAVIMLMFTAAASIIKEKDRGTLIRLRISNMTTIEWLASISISQTVIGVAALALTFLTCMALGYETSGSWTLIIVIGIISCLSIIAISVVVSAYLDTIFDLMTIGCFPFFILMFFSGIMFPLPPLRLFTLGGNIINVTDILPTTHSINALNKVLNYGAGLSDIAFEMTALISLTIAIFIQGTWQFTLRHMRPE